MLFIHNWYSFTFVNYWFVSSEINTWTRVDMKFLYFACHINTILARKVNFINEWNKRIDNTPQKKLWSALALGLKMKKCVELLQKRTMGVVFNLQNLSFDLVLTDSRNLSGTRPKSACGKSSDSRFSISAKRNVITTATEYVTFGFYFLIFVFFPI